MHTVLLLAYIDPGTGSMLLAILISLVTAASFAFKKALIKVKYTLSGGKAKNKDLESNKKIPLVLFSDAKQYANTFRPICEELSKRGIYAEYWTMAEDDPLLKEDYKTITCKHIGTGNTAFAKLNTMNAQICLSTTPGLDVLQWKRSKNTTYYAHVFHAIDDGTMYRMFGVDYYDALLTAGNHMGERVRKLEKLRNLPAKEIHIVGMPYLDELSSRVKTLKNQLTPPKHKLPPLLSF